jgi:type I restriction enzyme S subunit
MAGEAWKRMPLGDFVTLQRGHDLPDKRRRPGSVPILGSFGITGWHDEARSSGPGVTVGRSGASFGVVSYSPCDYWPLNTALYVIDFRGNDPRFAYYFLKQFDFKGYNSGSAQPSLNRNFIHPVPVNVPPPAEQRAIAHILGTLDDKIELNRRMNETLEVMAQALFKSWFMDFDPVHAKAEGRQPARMDVGTAALFPDSFIESELGLLPKGWDIKPVREIIEDLFDGPHATPAEASEGAVYLGIKNLTGTQIDLTEIRYISELDWPQWTKRVVP